jgi:predicted nucleic acid-binding protein
VIGYLDTSALVPLLITEASSAACQRFWNDADTVVSSRLLYAEAAAALAQGHRLRRISAHVHDNSLERLDQMCEELDLVEVDDSLVHRAAALAREFGLRGYDAIHCASAERLIDPTLVAAAGDQTLLEAWNRIGIAVYDTNQG